MKILSNELMKSIKFKYEENNIKYEEYYFNGIPIPKNIEIKDISYNSININWEIDNNIDNNKIKYIIEIRKENEKFNKIYEGNNNNCLLNNLSINTNYEFRICSFYNDSYGKWSEIKKVKTNKLDIDSNILKESKREDEFISKILEWSGYKRMELIYRGSIEEVEMEQHLIYFIINVIIKDLQLFYLKMKKEIFMEDIVQYLGIIMEDFNLFLKHLFLH